MIQSSYTTMETVKVEKCMVIKRGWTERWVALTLLTACLTDQLTD